MSALLDFNKNTRISVKRGLGSLSGKNPEEPRNAFNHMMDKLYSMTNKS